jgi:Arc/MetJ-type ribon-helix-helix transcriptional regulator
MMPELSEQSEKILDGLIASGRFQSRVEALERALQLLEHEIARDRPQAEIGSEEWSRQFREWAASRPPLGHHVDDSRDSIYSGTLDDPR